MNFELKSNGRAVSPAQSYDTLLKQRLALQNKASNILNACGLKVIGEALSSDEKLAEALGLAHDEIVRMQLRVIIRQIRTVSTNIAKLERTIQRTGAPRSTAWRAY